MAEHSGPSGAKPDEQKVSGKSGKLQLNGEAVRQDSTGTLRALKRVKALQIISTVLTLVLIGLIVYLVVVLSSL